MAVFCKAIFPKSACLTNEERLHLEGSLALNRTALTEGELRSFLALRRIGLCPIETKAVAEESSNVAQECVFHASAGTVLAKRQG